MSSVKVYIYDISGGLAKQVAPSLLGRELEGVWHTAVVVYGKEYFYGGDGISYCTPGTTILQEPNEVTELGETHIPEDLFLDYLNQVSVDKFRANAYHLLHNNCNHFTNEAAQFLTGRSVPDKVANLTNDVLNTPLGQFVGPMIDSMMHQMSGARGAFHIGPVPADPSRLIAPSSSSSSAHNTSSNSQTNSAAESSERTTADSSKEAKKQMSDLDLD